MITVVWAVLGLAAGLVAGRRFHKTSGGLWLDVLLGILGAIAGGLAMNSLGFPRPAPFVVAGLLGAAAGAVVILAGYRTIFHQA